MTKIQRWAAGLLAAVVVVASGCGNKGGVEKPSNPAPPPKKDEIKVMGG